MIASKRKGKRVTLTFTREFLKGNAVTFVELCDVGTKLEVHEPFGLAQFARGREAELESPVKGTIVAVNAAVNVIDNPPHVNDDPEGEGWLVVVEV